MQSVINHHDPKILDKISTSHHTILCAAEYFCESEYEWKRVYLNSIIQRN
jgi:hypothetical protein